jgi:heat shock protein HslJ
MKILAAMLFTVMFISCGSANKMVTLESNLHHIWVLSNIDGKDLSDFEGSAPSGIPTLEIKVNEMQYSGNDGCNNYFGGITELDETIIKFGIGGATRMMCENMEVPDIFNQTLPLVASYKIENLELVLFDKEEQVVMQLKTTE